MASLMIEQINDIILESEYEVIQSMLAFSDKEERMMIMESDSYVMESDEVKKKPNIIKRLIRWIKNAIKTFLNKIKSFFSGKKGNIVGEVDPEKLTEVTKKTNDTTDKLISKYKKIIIGISTAVGAAAATVGVAVGMKHHKDNKNANQPVNEIPKVNTKDTLEKAKSIKKKDDISEMIEEINSKYNDMKNPDNMVIKEITFKTIELLEKEIDALNHKFDDLANLYDTCQSLLHNDKVSVDDKVIIKTCADNIDALIKSTSNIIKEHTNLIIDYSDLDQQMMDVANNPTKYSKGSSFSYMIKGVTKLDKPNDRNHLLVIHNKIGNGHKYAKIEYRYQIQLNSMIYDLLDKYQDKYEEGSYVEIALEQISDAKLRGGIRNMSEIRIPVMNGAIIASLIKLSNQTPNLANIELKCVPFKEKNRDSQKVK